MSKKIAIAAAALALAAAAGAKIPAPVLDDAAKAKAAEAAAKTAWQAKVDAWHLCKAQDAVAAKYKKSQGGAVATKTAAPAQAAASKPQAAASKPQAAASGTPATAAAPSPCSDPGPFAYNPPEQKPLETSGAHSPAGTAASPPSVRSESGAMTSGKTGAPPPAAAASGKKS
jgi:hypothetical protein